MRLMEPFCQDYDIRLDEADCHGRVMPVALLDYLQDAAYSHADELGVAVSFLRQHRLTWVLSRYLIRFFHYPKIHQRVRVHTWPSSREGRFITRDYEITGADGQPVASATSSWALLNIDTRRPVSVDEHLPDFPLRPQRCLELPADKIPLAAGCHGEAAFTVRRSDIDVNRHVNHTVYVGWALDSLPAETVDRQRLRELEIAYRAEALYGDTVLARYHRLPTAPDHTYLQQLVNSAGGREFARLRTLWQ